MEAFGILPDDWVFTDTAVGPCSICGYPCRSYDPANVLRHPLCEEVRVHADIPSEPSDRTLTAALSTPA